MSMEPTGVNPTLSVRPQRPRPAAAPAQAAPASPPATPPAAADSHDAPSATATPNSGETDSAGRQRTVRLEDVQFGEIAVADPATFAPPVKRIPDDHPLMVAFRRSYDDKVGLDVTTPDQDAMAKILRRIASQEGKGVSIKTPRAGVVSFQATERRVVNRGKKDRA